MRRSRRLPPPPITHLETHHAYISPPVPEKGGLPTIIVTPAEPVSLQDFQIHFYSPEPTQLSFNLSRRGFLPRLQSFFSRSPAIALWPEKSDFGIEDSETKEALNGSGAIVLPSQTYATPPERNGDYVAVSTTGEDEEEFDRLDGEWTTSTTGSERRPSYLNRRLRTLIFLSVPMTLIAFHIISHHLGLFGSGSDGVEVWGDDPNLPSGSLGSL